MSRPSEETIPAVTELDRPNGLPTATTQSPTRIWRSSPNSTVGSGFSLLTLSRAMSVSRIGADQLGLETAAVGKLDRDLVRILDDVIVRHDQAGLVDDETRTGGDRLVRRA